MLESDLNLKIRGLTVPHKKITHKNCLVWCKMGLVIKVVFNTSCFDSQCAESNSRLSVYK